MNSHFRCTKGLTEYVREIRITILHQSSETVRNFFDILVNVKSTSTSTSIYNMSMIFDMYSSNTLWSSDPHQLNSPKKDQDRQSEQTVWQSGVNNDNVGLMSHPIDEWEILCHGTRNVYDTRYRRDSPSRQTNVFVRHGNTDHDKHCLLSGSVYLRTFWCISLIWSSWFMFCVKMKVKTEDSTDTVILTNSMTQSQTSQVTERTQLVDKRWPWECLSQWLTGWGNDKETEVTERSLLDSITQPSEHKFR